MVAGAPRAEYETNDISEVDRPKYPGGIFYCPVTTRHGDCSRVSMDKGGIDIIFSNILVEECKRHATNINLYGVAVH